MLKFLDKVGKVVGILKDESTEPEFKEVVAEVTEEEIEEEEEE